MPKIKREKPSKEPSADIVANPFALPPNDGSGWVETPEVRPGGVRVFERIVNGVREYKEE